MSFESDANLILMRFDNPSERQNFCLFVKHGVLNFLKIAFSNLKVNSIKISTFKSHDIFVANIVLSTSMISCKPTRISSFELLLSMRHQPQLGSKTFQNAMSHGFQSAFEKVAKVHKLVLSSCCSFEFHNG